MFKKILSVILCLVMTFGLATPLASAAAENYPVVYITGYGPNIFSEKGNIFSEVYYPTGADVGAIFKEAVGPCLKELAAALVTGNFDKYCDELYNAIHPIYENLSLNPDGTPKGNSGRGEDLTQPVFLQYDRFSGGEETFPYDWRLSPETSADELDVFIDKMIADTGASKVNIVARCLGGNVLSAYLQNYESIGDKVNKIVLYIPSTEGINMIGALFAGKIEIVAENLDDYLEELTKYEPLVEDPAIGDFINIMVAVLSQAKILNMGTGLLQKLIDEIKSNLVPRLIRRSYGSFPSFWAMVPDEYFEDALEFVYSTPELKEEYAGTIEKARSFHDNVMLNARKRLVECSEEVDITVISKYNIPVLPVFADCEHTGDGTAETYLTSFGATTAKFGTTLSADYISALTDKRFLSPDEKIDASTCALPEKTWFIKNSYHDHFPANTDRLIDTIFTSDTMDIFSNPDYPQYLDASVDEGKLVPVTGKDEEKPADNSIQGFFATMFKFMVAFFNLIKSLFAK